ncbi:MAG: CoB--CoM heterodisulfide reductase iron-sulfur subunit A family protein [Spirochaetes bacterium]|nr:CoB--CoM heterodisulfide reductase iron-sulfur subunit A family protein [Spirochaetota bacterium]
MKAHTLVIGAGIAGLQAALDLAEQGRQVVLVEKNPSIGGRMISLSKVYPTLDCASCITTPRMASVAHHPLIHTLTYTEVLGVAKNEDGTFRAHLRKKPRYIEEDKCIGCKRCEEVCPVYIRDDFEHQLGAKKAISIPFTNAIPQFPVLEPQSCTWCGACANACPVDCIDFTQESRDLFVEVDAVLLATGFQLTPIDAKAQYGGGKLRNVISSLQGERLLAPHGPYGRVLRPSDGKVPDSIAFVQCAGSRDASLGVPYCSRVCCMYAIKQAMLLSGSLPTADITIYYMDIRAFGKGYEAFYQNAKAMGINFVKAKVGRIREIEDGNLALRIERQEGTAQPEEAQHDLVILSLGLTPQWNPGQLAWEVKTASDGFVATPGAPLDPAATTQDGVFACGTATGPKDIVDSIMEAGNAATEVGKRLEIRAPMVPGGAS